MLGFAQTQQGPCPWTPPPLKRWAKLLFCASLSPIAAQVLLRRQQDLLVGGVCHQLPGLPEGEPAQVRDLLLLGVLPAPGHPGGEKDHVLDHPGLG